MPHFKLQFGLSGRTGQGMIPQTLNEIFSSIISRNSPNVMLDRRTGVWVPISAKELYRDVVGVAAELRKWGVRTGDRIAILSENRPEWAVADFAVLALGAVVVPLYTTLTAEQSSYILRDSGSHVIFVSNEKHLQKILAIQSQTPVEKIVVMDPVETTRAVHMYRLAHAGPQTQHPEFDRALSTIGPDDLATIIYTSGTTGVPKGAMLTHGNMASNLACSLSGFDIGGDDLSVSFLPLSHVTARHLDYAMLHHGITLAYVPSVDLLPQALREVKPTIFVGVPRVYEKVHTQVDIKASGIPKRWIYRWGLKVGERHRQTIINGEKPSALDWNLANRLLYKKIYDGMGGLAALLRR